MKTFNACVRKVLLALVLAQTGFAAPNVELHTVMKAKGKGGGQMVGGKNADGVPVEVTLSDKHPYESEIKDFIRNSELPAALKAEIKDLNQQLAVAYGEIHRLRGTQTG